LADSLTLAAINSLIVSGIVQRAYQLCGENKPQIFARYGNWSGVLGAFSLN
jgi:hypothetical protein